MAGPMTRLRLALELLGGALCLAAHFPIAFFYVLGSSLRGVAPVPYWAAIGAGYLAMLGLALSRPGPLGRVPWRRVLDRWLLTFPPAVAISAAFIWVQGDSLPDAAMGRGGLGRAAPAGLRPHSAHHRPRGAVRSVRAALAL